MSKPLCIYHGNCADGFGAAWVVRKAFQGDVDFHAGVYGKLPPDISDRKVYIVDFSYKRDVLIDMAKQAHSIVIIDHHKTAAEDLKDLPRNVHTRFDMAQSGAMLTWNYFNNDDPPELLKHIEDRDLWRFALPGAREIQAALFSYPYDFVVWDKLMAMSVRELLSDGRAIERKHHKDIDELLAVGTRTMDIGGYTVLVANLPHIYSSDAGHKLAKGQPFGACYWDTTNGRVFSLRSTDEGLDVSEIAKAYGGGGHRNAAGFTLSFETAKALRLL